MGNINMIMAKHESMINAWRERVREWKRRHGDGSSVWLDVFRAKAPFLLWIDSRFCIIERKEWKRNESAAARGAWSK